MRNRLIGLCVFVLGSSLFAFIISATSDLPFPSSITLLVLGFNLTHAFVSLTIQRGMIILYETFAYNYETAPLVKAAKYYAIFYTGVSYYVQTVLIRLPFLLNKFFELVFICMFTVIVMIFQGIFTD